MQLLIVRTLTPQKGMLGGDKGNAYSLRARLEVTADERAQIDRHKLHDVALTTRRVGDTEIDVHTVGKLLEGHTEYLGSLPSLMGLESNLVSAAEGLTGLLEFAQSFDEDRVVELTNEPASLV